MTYRHFVVYPSADRKRGVECARKWIAAGYEPMVMLDEGKHSDTLAEICATFSNTGPWLGYYAHINAIVARAFEKGADLVTCAADDMDPPPQGAQAVAEIYFGRFGREGFGVMQGTGDKQGDRMLIPGYEHLGMQPNAGRICGSPTFGRGWFERAYGGRGPFHAEYGPFYGDEDLWNVAMKCNALWLNPEVTIFHRHWSWHGGKQPYHDANQRHWERDKATFERRRAESFPGWERRA